jgi:PKHD-type hydroxylase
VCGWQYDVDGREAIQFAQYGPDQHYGWHVDVFPLAGKATDRKITTVCLLNDPSEFEGGQFQVRLYQEYSAPLEKGSVIAFPSILEHRVTPVLSGLRYTATIWFHGPRFR